MPDEATPEKPEETAQPNPEPDLKAIRKKVQVNGEEREMDAEEAFRLAQPMSAAQAKWQEAAKLREEAAKLREEAETSKQTFEREKAELFKMLKDDPFGVLDELGVDTGTAAEKRAKALEQWHKLSPAEQENIQLRQKLAKDQEEREAALSRQQQAEVEASYKPIQEKFKTDILEAAKASGQKFHNEADATEYVLAAVGLARRYIKTTGEVPGTDDLVYVLRQYDDASAARHRSRLEQDDDDAVLDAIGEKAFAKAQAAHLKRFKGKQGNGPAPISTAKKPAATEAPKAPPVMTREQAIAWNRQRLGIG